MMSELTRIPADYLTGIGEVKTSKELPTACPFESAEPYPLQEASFTDASPTCEECGESMDEYERCTKCSFGHYECDARECEICRERVIDRAEREMDAWQERGED